MWECVVISCFCFHNYQLNRSSVPLNLCINIDLLILMNVLITTYEYSKSTGTFPRVTNSNVHINVMSSPSNSLQNNWNCVRNLLKFSNNYLLVLCVFIIFVLCSWGLSILFQLVLSMFHTYFMNIYNLYLCHLIAMLVLIFVFMLPYCLPLQPIQKCEINEMTANSLLKFAFNI